MAVNALQESQLTVASSYYTCDCVCVWVDVVLSSWGLNILSNIMRGSVVRPFWQLPLCKRLVQGVEMKMRIVSIYVKAVSHYESYQILYKIGHILLICMDLFKATLCRNSFLCDLAPPAKLQVLFPHVSNIQQISKPLLTIQQQHVQFSPCHPVTTQSNIQMVLKLLF